MQTHALFLHSFKRLIVLEKTPCPPPRYESGKHGKPLWLSDELGKASYYTVIEAANQYAKFAKGFVGKHDIFHHLPMIDNI